ncbi:MAG: hypothetical protein MK213_07640 [Planctomycetes bacterium]|nr:hypothetical protein [Planctomycetota bacterium]
MILSSLLLAALSSGSGIDFVSAGEPLPFTTTEQVLFLGVEGDFSGELESEVVLLLKAQKGLKVVGGSVRARGTKTHRVFAVSTALEGKELERNLKRSMKKAGYEAKVLRGTALSLLERSSSSTVQRVLQTLEREEDKVWAGHRDMKAGVIWVFHESRFDPKELHASFRSAKIKTGFHHLELTLETSSEANFSRMATLAKESLDLVTSKGEGRQLILDVYLRDLEGMLALKNGEHTVSCPDIAAALGSDPEVRWTVRLENVGYPFLD